ncbi:MAG: exodeoxyribonuclease VII small subunit [Pirellulales bacterium]|nr:exodeoxyribonuclease VII small subunit [Pirellulales bacterium]
MSDPKRQEATSPTTNTDEAPVSFEAAVATLEQIVHELEEGQIGLNEAMARYERGVDLLAKCQEILERAERRIELLTGVDATGRPRTEPCDDAQPDAGLKQQGRRLRRGASGSATAAQPQLPAEEPVESDVDEPPFAL